MNARTNKTYKTKYLVFTTYTFTDIENIFICHNNIIFITPQIKVFQPYIKLQIYCLKDINIIFLIYM